MSRLYIIATPIGNMEDLSFRAVKTLSSIDVLASEDTRWTLKLYERYNLTVPGILINYHEYNEDKVVRKIIALLKEEKCVGLCSRAGYPALSDPGYKLVRSIIEEGFVVEAIPGPSAILNALVISGLPTSSFIFKGFVPKKEGQRKRFFQQDSAAPHTLILYESPLRIQACLRNALEILGNRKATLCCELTKIHERVYRGYLTSLIEQVGNDQIKGEITVVISGNNKKFIAEQNADAP